MSEAQREITILIGCYLQTVADRAEEIYFDQCPEEWADRPSMHEVEKQIKQELDILKEVRPLANMNCIDYSTEPKPIKPTFTNRIKSALSAIFCRNATA